MYLIFIGPLLLNPLVPNLHILDFCMENGHEDIKINQIGTIRMKCVALLIPDISFDSRLFKKLLQKVLFLDH